MTYAEAIYKKGYEKGYWIGYISTLEHSDKKLALHLMNEDPSLTEKEAIKMAEKILRE